MSLPPRIKLYWGKKDRDLMVKWDPGASAATARYLLGVLSKDVLAELDNRGFDITTIRFQIRKKPENGERPGSADWHAFDP